MGSQLLLSKCLKPIGHLSWRAPIRALSRLFPLLAHSYQLAIEQLARHMEHKGETPSYLDTQEVPRQTRPFAIAGAQPFIPPLPSLKFF